VVAEAILDRDRRVEGLGLGADVILPGDPAGLRLQGGDEAPAGAALIAGEDGGHKLLKRAARDDQLAVGEDRRSDGEVHRMSAGKFLPPGAQLPPLLSCRLVQRVDPAFEIAEEYGVLGDERRS